MKTISLFLIKRVACFICFAICVAVHSNAQTFSSSIDIGSAQQTINPTTTYNAWKVVVESAGIPNAVAYLNFNTAGPTQPPANTAFVGAVAINQDAPVLQGPNPGGWGNGTWLSCFPVNTIYTLRPAGTVGNFTNTAMTVRRRFNICSSSANVQVNINLGIRSDDYVNSIVLDANTPGQVILLGAPTPGLGNGVTINSTQTLAPGIHTVDVACGNWEEPTNAAYYQITLPNQPTATYQWNPFGVAITGTITAGTNILLNGSAPVIAPITGATDSICVDSSLTLSNTTPGGTWASLNTGAATINQGGVVTGITAGNVVITYTVSQGSCTSQSIYNLTVQNCHCEDPCSWSLTGNTTVLPGNFIGSINSADFKIRTGNIQKMVVKANGYVGIGTPNPAKLLEVSGETRITQLPSSSINDRIVFANPSGDLRSLTASGNTNQYLSGDGSWQNIPSVSASGIINTAEGLTDNGATAYLGDICGRTGGAFRNSRQINMNNLNLYFNSLNYGKLYMGNTTLGEEGCKPLYARLEIGSAGLRAYNDYSSPNPSLSGLRFSDMTASTPTIENASGGVLSLDRDGDVIWVQKCCGFGIEKEAQIKDILDRLTKLENELKASRDEAAILKGQLNQMDVLLSKTNSIVLNQNVPNPFNEKTVITYVIPKEFKTAEVIFTSMNGTVIKTAEIKQSGKGQINVFAKDISSGLYTYTLMVDGKTIDTKKMVKQ